MRKWLPLFWKRWELIRKKNKNPWPAPKPEDLLSSKEEDEENALDEDAELKATAREFMGNALLKILDEKNNEDK